MKPGITDGLANFLRDLRGRGLEFFGRYYGMYGGKVTDNADPQGQGRVRVTCKTATGRSEALDLWAYPTAEYVGRNKGLFFPPDIDDSVWVWFDHGDVTQPRYSGGKWLNTDQTKAPTTAQIPAEFKKNGGAPTARGWKTKRGHGMLIEDDTTAGARVEWWTGEPDIADIDGPAKRHHRISMTDTPGAEEIAVASFGGQKTEWIDIVGKLAVKTSTKNGWFSNILDSLNRIEMGGPKGFKFAIDEANEKITHETTKGLFARLLDALQKIEMGGPKGFKLTIDEGTGAVVVQTPAGRVLTISDSGQNISVTDGSNTATITPVGVEVDSNGVVTINSLGAMTLDSQAVATLSAQGLMTIKSTGLSITSLGLLTTTVAGLVTNTFAGLVNETFLGALQQAVTGLWSLTAGVINLGAPTVEIGSGGTKFVLVDERFLTLYNAHTHNVTAPAAPTGPPLIPAITPSVATSAVKAN